MMMMVMMMMNIRVSLVIR